MAKATSLVKAYMNEAIPPNGGFIICAFFEQATAYTIYEITAYKNVKDIYQAPEGIVFKTDGNRTHILVEPPTYAKKFTEPVNREEGKSIPYRFNEVTIISGTKSEKIMVPLEPVMLHSSFTILSNQADSFAFMFYTSPDVYLAMKKFIADSLYNDCNLTKKDAAAVSEAVLATIKKFSVWQL